LAIQSEGASFAVDVTAAGASYRSAGEGSSVDDLAAALRAAATYKAPTAVIVVGLLVVAVIAIAIHPLLLLLVIVGGIALLAWSSVRAARARRVAIVYTVDAPSAQAFESLGNGVGWLGGSHALWRVTHEEHLQRPANTRSVSRVAAQVVRGEAANVVTNAAVVSISTSGETLLFFPDALFVRDAGGGFTAVPYSAIRVDCETTHFSESEFVPPDSTRVGSSWLYANKDGSPDRRRANNRQIPQLEYGRVVLSWRNAGWVLLVSSTTSARHFANAVQAMVQFRTAKPVAPPKRAAVSAPRPEPKPLPQTTELERALAVSLERKRRQEELERQRAATPSKARQMPGEWIPRGGSATVHGLATGDFVYVGNQLPALGGNGVEPALIDPALTVDIAHPNTAGEGMRYWPSYSSIDAASRAAFLLWLAGGRRDPDAYIGYVFIFFYGLERRVYEFMARRGSNEDEVLAIAQEVARLLDLYGRSNSFASYAHSFLDLVAAIEPRARVLLRREPVQPGYDVPPRLKIALGELAVAGKPIPAELALDWVRATTFLNTPATRCAREFELLFHIRYAKELGDGLVVKPNKTPLRFDYRPASAALEAVTVRRDVPDITQLGRPAAMLTGLARRCSDALDPFSRFLGKNDDGRNSLAAFATLPADLVEATPSADAKALAEVVQSRLDASGRAVLGAGELLYFVRLSKPDKVSKNEAIMLVTALEKLGYGIEPDVRLGGPVFDVDGRAVVFRRLPDCPSAASDEYGAAMLLVRLCAMVSAADDEVSLAERDLITRNIEEHLELTPGERQRLAAHLVWLLDAGLGMTGLKRRIESLAQQERRTIARMLVEVAAADGRVDPREMKIMEKLYALLDLPEADLYRDVHAQSAADEPVVVAEPAPSARGFSIPKKPAPSPAGLDMARVRLKIAETRQVSALLSEVFTDDEPAKAAPAVTKSGGSTIGTLDAAHSELLRRLAARESWPRHEVEQMAAELALLPDGALETINDYAYSAADEPFWEDDDPVAINTKVAMELTQ